MTKQTIDTHDENYHFDASHNQNFYCVSIIFVSSYFGISHGFTNIMCTARTYSAIYHKDKNSDSVKHLNDNVDHEFRWFRYYKRKILEVDDIKTRQSLLNTQIKSDILNLLRSNVT